MPGFDRTGPWSTGPMTGGARGLCNPVNTVRVSPYAVGYGFGRGLGYRHGCWAGYGAGMGRGRGFGRAYSRFSPVFYPGYPVDSTNELDFLKAQAEGMKDSLDEINKRIEILVNKTAEES